MPKLLVNGVALHYEQQRGDGPAVVLVHGLATNLAFWYFSVAPSLPRDFNVTMFDLRGHGRSSMPPAGYTTADMAADLHELLNRLGVQRVHLVGHSYGGAVALHYTSLHPERVASLTLADARVRALQPTQRLRDWPHAEHWRHVLNELQIPVSLDDPEMGYHFLEVLAEAKLQGRELPTSELGLFSPFGLSRKSNRTAEQWLHLLRTTSARNDFTALAGLTVGKISAVRQPVLAVFGQLSNCLPSCWGLKQHLPNCRVVIVPRAGHFHPLSRPAFFGRVLHRFLTEVATRP